MLFSCRLSSFGKSAGLQNRKREVRCLQTVPRSGRCVPCPRPNADSEQCIKTVVTPNERSFHHETRIGNIHDNHHFILKWVAKWVRANEKHPETYVSRCYFLVGAGGFEPPKLKAADLQSVPIGHSGTRPYSFVSAARTACIYYHAQSSLSTICNRFYRNFCTNLSNKLAPWKNRPEINVPERFFLELVTGVEPATH